MNEAPFDLYIHDLLKKAKIKADYQGSSIKEINNALSTASKSQTGNKGAPDFTALVKNFVLIIEDKADRDNLLLRDKKGEISLTIKATKDYAINGALFYAKKILEKTSYKKIFAFGCAGEPKHHILKAIFVSNEKIIELDEFETFENFSPENIESYYKKAVLKEDTPEETERENIQKIAAELHEDLRNYGKLGTNENPLVVAAILLALNEQKYGFNLEQLIGDENADAEATDGHKIFNALKSTLNRANVAPEVKKDRVLSQFLFIKNTPILNKIHETLGKTPLKHFAEFINKKVYKKLNIENSAEDYIGRFYMEFIRYTGGDGQSLGIVITPKHITELFCDLVDLKPSDVIFDPCCGTGGFLIAGMHRMLKAAKNKTQKENIKKKNIHGIEIKPHMFSMATTSMILHGDGQSNLICEDFFSFNPSDWQLKGVTVGFMNPPYSQAKNKETANLSELSFIENLLDCVVKGGRVAVIVPVSSMIGKTKEDKFRKSDILKKHTLEGVISLNKNTFYGIGTVPCIAVFTAGEPHQPEKLTKFINFEDDGFEVKKHLGLVETERAKDRKQYLLDCWRGNIKDYSSKFMVETNVEASDEWLHSFYYYNDEIPTEKDFIDSIADYLTFEFNMIVHGRGYLFDIKQNAENSNKNIKNNQWTNFVIGNLFDVFLPSGDTQADKCEIGNIPLLSAGFNNNGICKYIKSGDEKSRIYCGNIISVDMFGQAFFHEYEFYSVSHGRINLLIPYNNMNKYHMKFITTAINKSVKGKFSYNQMCSSRRIKELIIQLPVDKNGNPDYAFMEQYIRQREQKLRQTYLEYISKKTQSFTPPPPD